MRLTDEKIIENWEEFRKRVNQFSRKNELNVMYDEMEVRISTLPASSIEYFHNAFPGGYVDHVLRVMDFSMEFYELYKKLGMIVENFTEEELLFSAMHHDLGKIGFPGEDNDGYFMNDSEWHRINQGKIYKSNEHIPFAPVQDKSLFLLQYYNVPCSWNEWHAIRTHDGPFEKVNEPYWIATNLQNKMRTNLATILHQADYAAARWEFERWAKEDKKFKIPNLETNSTPLKKEKVNTNNVDALFDKYFK